ncbi:hypothetical protein RCL_jg8805.t1 [Rhizophagus clarus]|uniref:Uncharacterized protein n=1 Tax=Rhizophagus clarus TaxID=94130 RepID=A0A8H3M437_9GLOM|nr:hypothetical protein RCL_jg8805.t1 [Rhizophagus clarus]
MTLTQDIGEDNKFRVELLECAKSLNLQNDNDYTKELFNQIPFEYYHVQEDENESIIRIKEGEEENINYNEKNPNIFIKKFLFEEFDDFNDSNELLNKVLSEITDTDSILCNNLETFIARDSIKLEEPLFPKKINLDDNFNNCQGPAIPTIKSLTPNYTPTQIPEPFLESEIQTYTIENLCPLYHEAMADEVDSATSLLKEQEIELKNDPILMTDLKFKSKYLEEPISPNVKDIIQQDIPSSIFEVESLFKQEVELFLKNDEKVSVIEEFGVKLPLEMMNEWERMEAMDDIADDLKEILTDNSKESEMVFDIPSSREMYELEPVLIPAKNDPLEMDRRKRRKKSETEEDIITTDSLLTVINHVVPEDVISISSEQDEEEELQKDLNNMIKIDTPFDQWQFIMMQSMDEICGLKFTVPSLPHPVTYASSDIPARLSDLVVSNSSESDFHIFSPFCGIKALELLLQWNPIKNVAMLEIDKLVDVSETPYDNLAEIIQEYICFDSDNLLELIDFKVTNENDEIYLKSNKEKKNYKRLKQLEDKVGFTTSRVASAASNPTVFTESRGTSAAVAPSNMFNNRPSLTRNYAPQQMNASIASRVASAAVSPSNMFNNRSPLVRDCAPDTRQVHKSPNSNRKIKSSNPPNKSVDIQQLLRKPTIGRFRNVERSMPDAMSWIREGNDDAPLSEIINEPVSAQDRVTHWLSNCDFNDSNKNLKNKNKYENIEVIDLTQDTDLSTPETGKSVDDNEITSPFFKKKVKSSDEQNHHNAMYFSNSFSATRSIDDFLILRGKLSPNKRPKIKQSNEKEQTASSKSTRVNSVIPILNKNSFITIGKSIIEKLPKPVVLHKYIVSVRMFPNRKLLTALKSEECKIELIERDFEYMRPFLLEENSDAIHVEVDFIIDERTGVIFYPLNMLSQDQSILKLAQTILRLHLKYPNLYLILETYSWNNRCTSRNNKEYIIASYPFTLPILRSISELKLILTCCKCDAKIMYSLCEEMSAKLLRMIGDSCATKCDIEGATRIGNHGWRNHKQWEERNWMTMEESLHERFLSCFSPLINPFTAQIILTATTLLQFFQMSHNERCALVGGWIDEIRLEKFDEIIHEILLTDSRNNDSSNDTVIEQLFTNEIPVIVID